MSDKQPVVWKLNYNLPNSTNRAYYSCSKSHNVINYITRGGTIDLINENGIIFYDDIDVIIKQMQDNKGIIWHGILSLDEKFTKEVGAMDLKDIQLGMMFSRKVDQMIKSSSSHLRNSEMQKPFLAIHRDTDNLHAHVVFFEKELTLWDRKLGKYKPQTKGAIHKESTREMKNGVVHALKRENMLDYHLMFHAAKRQELLHMEKFNNVAPEKELETNLLKYKMHARCADRTDSFWTIGRLKKIANGKPAKKGDHTPSVEEKFLAQKQIDDVMKLKDNIVRYNPQAKKLYEFQINEIKKIQSERNEASGYSTLNIKSNDFYKLKSSQLDDRLLNSILKTIKTEPPNIFHKDLYYKAEIEIAGELNESGHTSFKNELTKKGISRESQKMRKAGSVYASVKKHNKKASSSIKYSEINVAEPFKSSIKREHKEVQQILKKKIPENEQVIYQRIYEGGHPLYLQKNSNAAITNSYRKAVAEIPNNKNKKDSFLNKTEVFNFLGIDDIKNNENGFDPPSWLTNVNKYQIAYRKMFGTSKFYKGRAYDKATRKHKL